MYFLFHWPTCNHLHHHHHLFIRTPSFILQPPISASVVLLPADSEGESHWHSVTSPLLTCVQKAICRSGRQKDAAEPQPHSTGKHSSLSLFRSTVLFNDPALFFPRERYPLDICKLYFLSPCTPLAGKCALVGRVLGSRSFCLSINQLLPDENSYLSVLWSQK